MTLVRPMPQWIVIHIEWDSEKFFDLDIRKSLTVGQVKQYFRYRVQTGIKDYRHKVQVFYNGQCVPEHKTLGEIGITDFESLDMRTIRQNYRQPTRRCTVM